MKHDAFYNKALFLVISEDVLPQLPPRFSITELMEVLVPMANIALNAKQQTALRNRVKRAMDHLISAEKIQRSYDLSTENRSITFYTKTPK